MVFYKVVFDKVVFEKVLFDKETFFEVVLYKETFFCDILALQEDANHIQRKRKPSTSWRDELGGDLLFSC